MRGSSEDSSAEDDVTSGSRTDRIALFAFQSIEKLLLVVTALMVLAAASIEVFRVIDLQAVSLADILLMFLYTEVIAMIAVFYSGRGSPFLYPIFIAITALSRLIVLQGKDMAPQNILYEAAAILLLSLAALVIWKLRVRRVDKAPAER